MPRFIVRLLLVLVAGGSTFARPLFAEEGPINHLVDARWLAEELGRDDLLVLDASPAAMYAAGHIPGAVSVDLLAWYGVQEKSPEEMQALFRGWGVSPGRRIAMYDQGGTFLATRLFFSLYYYGFPPQDLQLLDGGMFKWQEAGLPVTAETPPGRGQGTFTIGAINEDVRARLPEYVTASGDPRGNALLEALGADWHFGEVVAFDRAGHIPHAILLPSADFFNADRTFKPADEIRRMLSYLGVKPEQQVYTHCGGGMAASVPFFAVKFLAGYPRVKLFIESELGWLADDRGLPYWTYDAPYLLRAPEWLQFRGGAMVRRFGGTRVSVIDVRPAGDYAGGHVPFALNLPGAVFRDHVTRPAELAAILGPAGVDASHEAVIVSGGGLTKDAALAFALLEKLGQQSVSVMAEPLERWAQRGYPLTEQATTVGPKKAPQDMAVPPTDYSGRAREGAVTMAAGQAGGLYPAVFVASGLGAPPRAPQGTVVHVPYTDLLDEGGNPKAAKDIWSTLAKAGVPRYAQLVCFADDPGEAACNYFVLRLMGFPDVKILLP